MMDDGLSKVKPLGLLQRSVYRLKGMGIGEYLKCFLTSVPKFMTLLQMLDGVLGDVQRSRHVL